MCRRYLINKDIINTHRYVLICDQIILIGVLDFINWM